MHIAHIMHASTLKVSWVVHDMLYRSTVRCNEVMYSEMVKNCLCLCKPWKHHAKRKKNVPQKVYRGTRALELCDHTMTIYDARTFLVASRMNKAPWQRFSLSYVILTFEVWWCSTFTCIFIVESTGDTLPLSQLLLIFAERPEFLAYFSHKKMSSKGEQWRKKKGQLVFTKAWSQVVLSSHVSYCKWWLASQ